MLLLCMANYITFTAARSILSTFQGYQETKYVNQEGVYIANLDPDSHIDAVLLLFVFAKVLSAFNSVVSNVALSDTD